MTKKETSWEKGAKWYDSNLKEGGDFTHKLVLPYLISALELGKTEKPILLEVGCGQGVFARMLPPKSLSYIGVDLSKTLIDKAKKYTYPVPTRFIVGNALDLPSLDVKVSHALFLLSLQNMEDIEKAFSSAAKTLIDGGRLVLLFNHPCFRIPRQSSWGIDQTKKLQYRRIDRYMTPLEIPIDIHPGKKENNDQLLSFHLPLTDIFKALHKSGFSTLWIEEICSDKESVGSAAKMENRARKEFPLFFMLVAKKG